MKKTGTFVPKTQFFPLKNSITAGCRRLFYAMNHIEMSFLVLLFLPHPANLALFLREKSLTMLFFPSMCFYEGCFFEDRLV